MTGRTCAGVSSAFVALALLWLSGCDDAAQEAAGSTGAMGSSRSTGASGTAGPSPAAPVTRVRATLYLEPSTLAIGEVTTAEVTVVTPPGYRLHAVSPPDVPGVWLLDAQVPQVERGATRWVHRARIRARTREVGPFVWPAFQVTVEGPAGAETTADVGQRAFEVVSVLKDFPDQAVPFGLRGPDRTQGARSGFWWGVGTGATTAIALASIFLAVRRKRDRVPLDEQTARRGIEARETTLWDWSERELAEANALLASPEGQRAAANRGALLLRRYVSRRFNVDTEAFTTIELSARKPPLAIESRWPEMLRILRRFDDERFRQLATDDASAAWIESELAAVRRFIDDSMPPELRQ